MRYSVNELQPNRVSEILLHAFESGFYLVEAEINGIKAYVTNERGDNLSFRSIQEAREGLRGLDVPMWLVEETAYDEMCGSTENHTAPMKVPLHL